MNVYEHQSIKILVNKYQIGKQYKKACHYIENQQYSMVDLKLRQPRHLKVYQFRITKKFRAFAVREGQNLIVYKISDHQ